jgi:hypothetical protein
MPQVGSEPTDPAFERLGVIGNALLVDRTTSVIGLFPSRCDHSCFYQSVMVFLC